MTLIPTDAVEANDKDEKPSKHKKWISKLVDLLMIATNWKKKSQNFINQKAPHKSLQIYSRRKSKKNSKKRKNIPKINKLNTISPNFLAKANI